MTTTERKRTLNNRPPPFPEDFGERLERLKELTGLPWGEFAERLGVTQRGLAKWRNGGPPSMSMVSENVRLSGQRKCHLYCSR